MTDLSKFIKITTAPAITETKVVELAPAVINVQLPLETAEVLTRILGRTNGSRGLGDMFSLLEKAVRELGGDPHRFYVLTPSIVYREREAERNPPFS